MGKKMLSRTLAVVLALALVMTSGIGVFAESGSPTAGKVSNVTSVAYTTSMTVKWSKASNAKTYNVYLNGKLVKSKVTGTSVKITGLKAGKTYTVTVAGVNAGGKVGAKSSVTTYLKSNAASKLTKRWLKKAKIKKVTAGKKKATITWKKVSGAKSYQVLMYKGGKWQVVKTTKATKATVKKLTKGKKYKFRVRAIKSGNYVGIWSASKTSKKIK